MIKSVPAKDTSFKSSYSQKELKKRLKLTLKLFDIIEELIEEETAYYKKNHNIMVDAEARDRLYEVYNSISAYMHYNLDQARNAL